MRSLSRCSSLVLLLSLVLLCLSQCSAAPLPRDEPPQLSLALLHLQDLLDHSQDQRPERNQDPEKGREQESDEESEQLNSLEPFSSWDESDLGSNQEVPVDWGMVRSERDELQRDLEDGGRLSEALSAVAGGLQAISREKGGIGFRFGRKRTPGAQD